MRHDAGKRLDKAARAIQAARELLSFVEIPSRTLSDPVDTFAVGVLTLRVIRKEVVLADRIVGFKYWGVPAVIIRNIRREPSASIFS